MTGPRDWDKDLAAVDKAIESWKATTPGKSPSTSAKPTPVVVAAAAEPRKGAMATWLRVLLVLAFAVAVPFWPYPRACGINLFLYMGVITLLVVAGLWGAANSWSRRLGTAHVLSLLTVVWGLALLAAEVLPRVGYAAQSAQWMCP